jgi:hypothetical protein
VEVTDIGVHRVGGVARRALEGDRGAVARELARLGRADWSAKLPSLPWPTAG